MLIRTMTLSLALLSLPGCASHKGSIATKFPESSIVESEVITAERITAVGMVEITDFDFKIDPDSIAGDWDAVKIDLENDGHQVRVFSLKKGTVLMGIRDEQGKLRAKLQYDIMHNDLSPLVLTIRRLLQNVKKVSVEMLGESIVIDGKPDSADRERILQIQARFSDVVLNLAAPVENLCTTRICGSAFNNYSQRATSESQSFQSISEDKHVSMALPSPAWAITERLEKDIQRAEIKHNQNLEKIRLKAVGKLRSMAASLERAGKRDESDAILGKIDQVRGQRNIASWETPKQSDVGKKVLVELVGSLDGPVWGAGPYTSDSNLQAAAVHAGLLRPGESGLIEVEILEGKPGYQGTLQNGVYSQPWGQFEESIALRKANH